MTLADDRLEVARRELQALPAARWTPQLVDELALRAFGLEDLAAAVRAEAFAAGAAGRRRVRARERDHVGLGVVVGRRLGVLALFVGGVLFVLTFPRSAPLGDATVAQAVLAALVALLLVAPGVASIRSATNGVVAMASMLAAGSVVAAAVAVDREAVGWPATVALVAAAVAVACALSTLASSILRRRGAEDALLHRIATRAEVRAEIDAERRAMRADVGMRVVALIDDLDALLDVRAALLAEMTASTRPRPPRSPSSRLVEPEPIDAAIDAPPGAWIVDTLVRMPRDEHDAQLEATAARMTRGR